MLPMALPAGESAVRPGSSCRGMAEKMVGDKLVVCVGWGGDMAMPMPASTAEALLTCPSLGEIFARG